MTMNAMCATRFSFHKGRRRALLLECVCLLGIAAPIWAQQTPFAPQQLREATQSAQRTSSVHGRVVDTANKPIPFARVVWGDAQQVITTTDSGSFSLTDIPAGKTHFTVRRLGYVPVDFDLVLKPGVVKPVVVNLMPVASELSEVTVEAHKAPDDDSLRAARFEATGFFDRQAHIPGYFIPPDEVEKRRPTYVSDLMFSVPGVVMIGRPHTSSLRYVSAGQRCRLQLYLDGHPASDGDDFVNGSDIKAIEVYPSLLTASERFLPSPLKGYCGSIVVWTK